MGCFPHPPPSRIPVFNSINTFQYDRTAVHIAAERGFSDIVEYLVDKVKVDVNFRAKVSLNKSTIYKGICNRFEQVIITVNGK